MSRPALITTPPVAIQCHRCAAWIAAGTSEGLKTRVDLTTLTLTEQIWARLLGLELYWLTPAGLWLLDEHRVKSAHRWTIVPQHRCGLRWPPKTTELPQTPTEVDTPPY